MRICPICRKKYEGYPALSRKDNRTNICPDCGTMEALEAVPSRHMSPQEKAKAAVMETGNKWAIENFNATHD